MIFFSDRNKTSKKARNVFRPTLGETRLEDRLVMSVGAAHVAAAATQTGLNSTAQVHAAYARAFRASNTALQNYINDQATQLFANGRPTADQLANFRAQVAGAVNSSAFARSSQLALLPRSGNRVSSLQNSFLGSNRSSLINRIDSVLQSSRNLTSASRLQNAINRQLSPVFSQTHQSLANYFNTTPLNRLSVDSNGNRIGLQQFLGGQVVNQFTNSLGSFANAFPNVANSMLFPNGPNNGGTPSSDLIQAFNGQAMNALGTITAQLGNNLSLFPNSSTLASQLNPMLFGSGTGATGSGANTGFLNSLQNLQYGGTNFNNDLMTAFNGGFSNLSSPLNSFFGLQGQQNATLPTSGFSNVFGSNFTGNGFNNGFNNGFASNGNTGFIGFGQAPTGFNNAFGTGFNGLNTSLNNSFGFNFPTLGSTPGFGGPGGVGIGTGTGNLTGGNIPGGTSTGGTGIGTGTGGFF